MEHGRFQFCNTKKLELDTMTIDTETITYLKPKIWDFLLNETKGSVCGEVTYTSK